MNRTCRCLALAALLLASLPAPSGAQAPNPNDWLLNAPDDQARFRLLQEQGRGFSASMIEVGQRYLALHDALRDGNAPLAAYQWEKLREAIRTGYARRPGRRANADRLLLGPLYDASLAEFRSGDAARAAAAFTRVRAACMECHDAERVPFMNNQPIFRRTAEPPRP
jgi:hypothetical protein